MAQLDRKQLLSMLSIDEIARIALRLAPKEYDKIVALDSAPERVELLIEFALVGNWFDELVDTARFRSYISSNIDAQLASANPAYRLLNSSPSTSPVFTNTDPYDVLDLTIQTDFDTVNNGDAGNDQSPGYLSYDHPVTGKTVTVDCIVQARGNSRRQCGWRPLRFHFDGSEGHHLHR